MKIFELIFVISILFSCGPSYNYKITDSKNRIFYCNFYNETSNGCVLFNKSPGLHNTPGEPYMICGFYKIEKLK
jgi:hypothetical protein